MFYTIHDRESHTDIGTIGNWLSFLFKDFKYSVLCRKFWFDYSRVLLCVFTLQVQVHLVVLVFCSGIARTSQEANYTMS